MSLTTWVRPSRCYDGHFTDEEPGVDLLRDDSEAGTEALSFLLLRWSSCQAPLVANHKESAGCPSWLMHRSCQPHCERSRAESGLLHAWLPAASIVPNSEYYVCVGGGGCREWREDECTLECWQKQNLKGIGRESVAHRIETVICMSCGFL